jgi:hypothetical protein
MYFELRFRLCYWPQLVTQSSLPLHANVLFSFVAGSATLNWGPARRKAPDETIVLVGRFKSLLTYFVPWDKRRHECRRGTQECARHELIRGPR